MSSTNTYVQFTDGPTIRGPIGEVQIAVEAYITWKVSEGGGCVVLGASQDVRLFLLELRKRYPWKGFIGVPPDALPPTECRLYRQHRG